MIDNAILAFVAFIPAGVLSALLGPDEAENDQAVGNFYIVLVIVLAFFYFWLMASRGATLGMSVLKMRIVPLDGASGVPSGRALGRTIVYMIGSTFFLGCLWMLWDKEARTWHDKVTNTAVVYEESR